MPEIPTPQDRKKTVAFPFEDVVFTLEYYAGIHSKDSINALYEFMENKHLSDPPAYVDGLIKALLGFKMTWDATHQGFVIPTDEAGLSAVDGSFLEACLVAIVTDCLPKEAGGENSASGTTQATSTSEPRRQRGKKKQE